jgi:hypothetical protein
MTSGGLAVPRVEEESPRRAAACAFCRRRLADEYFFTCRVCEASFCYIHMSRHQPVLCARKTERSRSARAAPARTRLGEVALERSGRPLVVGPSANV